ncbi:MAG: fibronectin type III domain-containing protein [Patescibacteria group bacterium]
MKKFLPAFIMGMLVLGVFTMPFNTGAQTAGTTSIQTQLETIKKLTEQIQALQAQLNKVVVERQSTVSSFLKTLKQGDRGDAVKTLQAILAADSELYPEGLITGFYGKATAKAVIRFQKRNGLETVGNVGPKTLVLLNKEGERHPLAFEKPIRLNEDGSVKNRKSKEKDDDDDNDRRPCAIVPPGHLIAPGWLRKHGGERPIVPICQILPPGIDKKIDHATTTPDTTAPVISSITTQVATTSAIVSWVTNEAADTTISYGTSTAYGLSTVLNSALVTNHTQTLTGLMSNTTYHFQVRSRDAAGNLAVSTNQALTTGNISDTTAPVISSITVTNTSSTSALVSWITDETADTQIEYGTSTAYGLATTLNITLVTSHSQALTGLMPSTTYHFRVKSKDATGNMGISTDQTLTTTALPDTTSPVMSGITLANVSSTSATINWTTDELATSKMYYGLVNPVNLGTASTTLNATLVTGHSLGLSGLTALSTYFFVLESQDASGNTALSSQQSFTTTP